MLDVALFSGVRHAAEYGPLLADTRGVRLVGVYEEPDVEEWMWEASGRVADELGVPLLGEPPRVDVAVVCSEPTRHARLAAGVLRGGGRVLVDKPAATELGDAADLVRLSGADGERCAVMSRVLVPGLRRARSWVDAGHIGLPRHVDVEFLAHGARFATSVERPGLVVDPRLSGGGELLNFGGYAIDAIRHLTGCAVVEVHAETGTLFSAAHAEHEVEDVAVLSLLLERGVTATATVGRVPAAPTSGPNAATLRVIGSRGSFAVDDDSPALLRYGDDGSVTARSAGGPAARQGIEAVLDDAVAAFAAGRPPAYTILDAHWTLSVLDAAYRSAASGTPQHVQS
ncbi:Gfo/Idh/MocA family protein [Saccharopolyspora endophytica]|uniref:Gfo/Idh/MocA family oxidoreductase n=1 Tax=Saccharopolyspora endophytica TaxID=543886 RepID=A0ABS5DQ30_9PSEU|nr:Gfo/Idh/MocA family oxidoreductase [Saccharopolyspora endophytica]MBQ0928393.1 Gfo/Idh/MocA family oxidoreductase [Saccharopolyspora endophytica]